MKRTMDEPHQPSDCDAAVAELYTFVDMELTAENKAVIAAHLEACRPCVEVFDFHIELKALVARCCATEVPPDLRDRILSELDRS